MRRFCILVLTIPAFIIGSCGISGAYGYEIPRITGCVIDSKFNPLQGIGVELVSSDGQVIWNGQTDVNGHFLYNGRKNRKFFSRIGIGDRVYFVTVNLYRDGNPVFSETYDVLALARNNEIDGMLADLTKRNTLPKGMADIEIDEPGCFVI